MLGAGPLRAQMPEREIPPLPVTLTAQPEASGRQVWHTANFRIDLDLPLAADELKRVAQVIETTAWVVKHYPLPLYSPPPGRCRVAIYARDEDYTAAGAPGGTAGYYSGWRQCVFIRGASLVPTGDGRHRLLPRHDEDLVVHELVHLCTHGVNRRMPQWFVEGIAETFACAHLGGGRFSFANQDVAVREYLRARMSPRNPVVTMSPLKDLVGLDDRTWQDYQRALPAADRFRPYASSLLLTHYYLHGSPERLEWLRAKLTAPRGRTLPAIETTGIEAAIIRYWTPKGIAPVF